MIDNPIQWKNPFKKIAPGGDSPTLEENPFVLHPDELNDDQLKHLLDKGFVQTGSNSFSPPQKILNSYLASMQGTLGLKPGLRTFRRYKWFLLLTLQMRWKRSVARTKTRLFATSMVLPPPFGMVVQRFPPRELLHL
jgi:hypothetical protein